MYQTEAKGVIEDENGAMEGYFFCRLKKASPNGKNISRCVIDHGTWSNKSKPKDVYDEAMRMIGTVRYFKFQPAEDKKSEPVNKIEWKMHEYSVAKNDLVLCHISNKLDSSTDDVAVGRGLKRVSNYEIGSSSKHCRVEKSPECPTAINNPAQDEGQAGHQVMQYGFQNQQYYMPNQSIHQQYTMPPAVSNEVQYVMPNRFPDQGKYLMPLEPHQQDATPQGHGLPDRQYTMSHGHESTTYETFGDGFEQMITSDRPQLVQGGGTYCNDKHDAVYLPWVKERGSMLNDEERCDTQNDDNGDEETGIRTLTEEIEGMMNNGKENDTDNHEETSNKALAEEIEGMMNNEKGNDPYNHVDEETSTKALADEIEGRMNNDKENDTNNHIDEDTTDEAFIEELEGIPSDPHEAQGDELYYEQDMTTSKPHLAQVGEDYNQDMMQVQPADEVETYGTHQDAFSNGNNGIQEDTSWRSKLGFEHEDDDVDFDSWLPALAAA